MNLPFTSLVAALDHQSAKTPERVFINFRDDAMTFAEAADQSRRLAAAFHALGVGQGSIVPGMLPNARYAVLCWFACNRLGAVWAPINTEFRGAGLSHAIGLTAADILVCDNTCLAAVEEVIDDLTVEIITLNALNSRVTRLLGSQFPASDAFGADISLLIYTSGTTGKSKACQLSHHYLMGQAMMMIEAAELSADDVLYCPYPLFHLDASALTTVPALLLGARAVIPERFSVSRFWPDIREFACTTFDFMGATLGFIHKQPERDDDRIHSARLGWGVPMPPFKQAFEERFGVRLMEGYGATECGCPVWQFPGETYPPGSCGRSHTEYRVYVVDENDQESAPGEVGEIVVEPRHRDMMMRGYYRDDEANRRAFRIQGAICMGDRGKLDEAGNLYFIGRREDAIRRRGENISASEVEEIIDQHPAVLEVAVYGIPSPNGEDEVAAAVVLQTGTTLSADTLQQWCQQRMAKHMIPSSIHFLQELPKTPTRKVERHRLRELHTEP